jgi:hypothetical protein
MFLCCGGTIFGAICDLRNARTIRLRIVGVEYGTIGLFLDLCLAKLMSKQVFQLDGTIHLHDHLTSNSTVFFQL